MRAGGLSAPVILTAKRSCTHCSSAQDGAPGAWFEFFMQVCCLERLLLATEGVSGARGRRLRGASSRGSGLAGNVGHPGGDVAEQHGKEIQISLDFLRKIGGDGKAGALEGWPWHAGCPPWVGGASPGAWRACPSSGARGGASEAAELMALH